jgi:Ca-activated chloride channel family protein
VGDRKIRGIIRERQEAEKIYKEARSQGYVASLLTQERPNIFTQSVANIEPGKQIDINIKYFNTLSYSDGWYEFAFPLVVGPRFNPPGTGDGVGAVDRAARGALGQKAEVPYLRPGERSGHDVALAVALDAGVAVEQIESRTHRVTVKRTSPRRAEVTLDEGDRIPNRDFVLRWKVAGDGIKSGLLVHRDDRDGQNGGYFSLMLVPPDDLKKLPRSPVEMVFTLDVSGSMMGRPIEQAKSAVRYALTHMRADDTFQIVRFSGAAETFAPRPVPATPENIRRGLKYIEGTSAGGGTMMIEGIRRSLEFPADESRPRCVAFLTDGYIGNEAEILGALHQVLGPSRVFSFGVGSAVNRYLLEHMAKLGNGAVAYVGLNEGGTDAMAAYFERVSHPAMTNLSIDWGGARVGEVFPQRVPDLFVGRPVILTGRFTGAAPTVVKMTGQVRGEPQHLEVAAEPGAAADDGGGAEKALPLVWARMKIADLADRSTYENTGDLPGQVRQVALEYGLMSNYTAFVAVDSLTRTQGDHGTTVSVPVPVPEGVQYETTVIESGADKERG